MEERREHYLPVDFPFPEGEARGLKFSEKAIADLFIWYLEINKLKTENARKYFKEITRSLFLGQERKLSEDCLPLLEEFEKIVSGKENIPSSGPLLVVANHYASGPLKGNWESLLINNSVASQRENNDLGEVRWIIQRGLQLWFLAKKFPLTASLSERIAQTYNLILVEPPFEKRRGELFSSGIRGTLLNGEVMGLYPEATTSETLKRGVPEAGGLVRVSFLICPELKVLFCGAWIEGEKRLLLNFGPTLTLSDFPSKMENQEMADFLTRQVAGCLPENRHGVYTSPLTSP